MAVKKVYTYEVTPNYSEKQERELKKKKPHTKGTAKAFALKHNKSLYSVISKIKQMKLEYTTEADRAPPYEKKLSREELVKDLGAKMEIEFSKSFSRYASRTDLLKIYEYFSNGQTK